ncbi:hypothetical protein KI440_00420 [Candidatus Saccharibacteria bacterium TM7i]|nr:hypothetical protein KI440_00420 [Candidatus Saccharibacteria bacterium TM7i]
MSTFTLKSIAQRGSMLVAAAGLLAATFAPAVFADALNPLTERSLLLSSSAPGWQDTDGSGYSEANPNPGAAGSGGTIPGHYAPAGSGANGRKTGQTFSFRISTAATEKAIKAFTLQYCVEAAGLCAAPGDNDGDGGTRDSNATGLAKKKSDLEVNYGTDADAGVDFKIYANNTEIDYTGWELKSSNKEDAAHTRAKTGKDNFITLQTSGDGIDNVPANAQIRIVFLATENKYITNPGSGSFFVKMNTFDTNDTTPADHSPAESNTHLIDGGVTVANVMADSIHITTKVLETMQFSVGTENPDQKEVTLPATHGTCDAITTSTGNRLQLGNVNAESSLETGRGFGVSSFWRLSSNSSGGASVYYSGETLTNTVGDMIAPIGGNTPGTETLSLPGTEQFGLAFQSHGAAYNASTPETNPHSASFEAMIGSNSAFRTPNLYVLNKAAAYDEGDGSLGVLGQGGEAATAKFAFDRGSLTSPVAIADNLGTGGVLTCETAKMRYVANIAADTPAGVYTTKINYLAAPQY